jgi:predicted nucleic acid-binding protein
MEIVVDTTVVIAVITNEATKQRLIDMTRGAELVAPASMPWEIGNAFSAMFKQRRATKEQALAGIAEYRKIAVRLVDVAIENAVAVSADLGIYAYDAYMICCAQQIGAPLLTLDARLKASAAKLGVNVLEVSP